MIDFEPLDVAFTQGRLRADPQIRLAGNSAVLSIGSGRVIEQAHLTAELLEMWLQYVAPLLANSARAEGQFSIDIQRATVPLNEPAGADVAGALTIHAAQVRPGPMTEKLAAIAQQIDAILRKRPQATATPTVLNLEPQLVPFEVMDGRVHHRDFHIEVGDVMVRSRGSVGMDKSLALVAEVPIRDAWVERDPNLKVLQGQTLEIPIRGTLANPKIDNRVLKDLAKKVAGGAANRLIEDALQDGLNKGLDGLFKQLQR